MIIKTIPKSSNYLQTVTRFTANFNVPAPGQYDFNTAANTGIVILEMNPHSVYFIDKINFSTTTPEEVFFSAVNTVPTATLRKSKDKGVIYQRPLPLVSYLKANEAIAFFWTRQNDDSLIVDFRGILDQPAPLVGVPTIKAQLQLDIYQIMDENWIQLFRAATRLTQQTTVFI